MKLKERRFDRSTVHKMLLESIEYSSISAHLRGEGRRWPKEGQAQLRFLRSDWRRRMMNADPELW